MYLVIKHWTIVKVGDLYISNAISKCIYAYSIDKQMNHKWHLYKSISFPNNIKWISRFVAPFYSLIYNNQKDNNVWNYYFIFDKKNAVIKIQNVHI